MKLNTNKFAKLCGVSTGTIRYWARKNELKFEYTTGGQRRFDESEVIIFLNKSKRNNIFVVEDLKKYNSYSSEYMKAWRNNNKNKCRKYSKDRNHKNLDLSAIKWMRNFLYRTEKQGFNKSKLNTITEFGYTPKQLINRIEYQFKNGMSWNNRKEWHIDHKKPISKFSEGTSPRIINMLCNLQPIWATENLFKNNKF